MVNANRWEQIQEREKEIEELLQKVLEEERQKKEEEEKKKKEEEDAKKAEPEVDEDIIECADAAPAESAPPGEEPKKKRGNLFQRMVHALRKRFGHERGTRAQVNIDIVFHEIIILALYETKENF
ncbi:hypothetical protein CAPTEDRAFT_188339 [Capitella teleta]|uniref:Uncharacterized protein n=1 Tax=Capitella teleta TaxID=283909 RepID=R7VLR1_CAPTE|nr:hypothetical protein CAPTEDRAFT_188339 [Capitella teleta]|eukprot:ELU18501.1 hypothetical protein CAPTEDRAFT_188339 [Capitella teleta]